MARYSGVDVRRIVSSLIGSANEFAFSIPSHKFSVSCVQERLFRYFGFMSSRLPNIKLKQSTVASVSGVACSVVFLSDV